MHRPGLPGLSVRYNIMVDGDKLYLQVTKKDKISYISQTKVLIADTIKLAGFEIVAETRDIFVFATDDAYYLFSKESHYSDLPGPIERLYSKIEVDKVHLVKARSHISSHENS